MLFSFRAESVRGSGRGKSLGSPTVNLSVADLPPNTEEGVYACTAAFDDGKQMDCVMHYGPRPVFHDDVSCEIHILDKPIESHPSSAEVFVFQKLRDVQNFASPEDLKKQIQADILNTRSILKNNAHQPEESNR